MSDIVHTLLKACFLLGLDERLDGMSTDIKEVISRQRSQEHQTILDWLTPIDYAPQQTDYIRRRQPGTGQWLLDSAEFQAWLENDSQALFCPGIPGAGKTILASIVVSDLCNRFRHNTTVGIAYIYCNFKRKHEQTLEDLLLNLLKQLAQSQFSLSNNVKILYEHHQQKRTRPLFDELSRALQSVAAMYSRVFIIVDALDECQASDGCRARFLSEIFTLQAKARANLFATSRHISNIEKAFKRSTLIEIRASEEDVRRYLDGHVLRLPGFVTRSPDLQEEIKAAIVKAVDGMYGVPPVCEIRRGLTYS
jgi:Cdc6-like AAA superfamily ATPase